MIAPVKQSQESIVLSHLLERGSITGVEADAVYKIRWLPTRIKALRDEGYEILSTWKKDGAGQKYVRYTLNHTDRLAISA